MKWYDKKTNSTTTDLSIDYTSQFRISKETNYKSLKPYYWCPHACWYCYVIQSDKSKFRYIPKEFHNEIPKFSKDMYIVEDNIEKVRNIILADIKRWSKNKDKYFHMAYCSDPFPYSKDNEKQYEDVIKNTLELIKMINSYGYKVELITKWLIPVEEIQKVDPNRLNSYCISVPTLDFEYTQKFEPKTSPIEERIKRIKQLDELWYDIWINIAPLFLWELKTKTWKTIYKFKTWAKEIYEFLSWFKNLKHLRIETLRGKNPFQNEISQKELEEIEKVFYKIVEEKWVKRFFLDLWFNKLTDDMEFIKNSTDIYFDEKRAELKQKINKLKKSFTY